MGDAGSAQAREPHVATPDNATTPEIFKPRSSLTAKTVTYPPQAVAAEKVSGGWASRSQPTPAWSISRCYLLLLLIGPKAP